MSVIKVNNITNLDGTSGPVIAGITTVSSTSHFVVPTGRTGQRYADDGENIVRDGLVLYLDAKYSYPSKTGIGTTTSGAAAPAGSSTDVDVNTWYDISGSESQGELIGGVGYNAANGGSLVFDGTNDRVEITQYQPIHPKTKDFTIEVWAKADASIIGNSLYNDLFGANWKATGAIEFRKTDTDKIQFLAFNGSSTGAPIVTSSNNITSSWVCYTGTLNRQLKTISLYTNGSLNTSSTYTISEGDINYDFDNGATNDKIFFVGARFRDQYWKGNIAVVRFYHKSLTAAEVLQNFNATRSRYGI
jgi:hypothetical protein